MLWRSAVCDSRSRGTSIGTGSIYFGGPSGFSLDPDVTLKLAGIPVVIRLAGKLLASAFDRARDPLFSGDYAMVGMLEDRIRLILVASSGTCPSGSLHRCWFNLAME